MKPKTYVITVAKNFLAGHPKKGLPTNFPEKILNGTKTHTIRQNFEYWHKIVKKVNSGEGVLSIRQWTGKPYKSYQQQLFVCQKLEIQKVFFRKAPKNKPFQKVFIQIDGEMFTGVHFDKVAHKDGFNDVQDFIDWFPQEMNGCIIHFDAVKY